MQRIVVEEFIEKARESRIVDVRSPAEFQKGHISGAINIPIFSNQERAEVGTIFKQKSKEEAILLGLDIVGPKLKKIAEEGKDQAIDNTLFVYCWRGGMRSEKMAWLFELNGIDAFVLEGGYKKYRSNGKELINRINEYIIVQGPTGSGKTEIINALSELGEQVIDLEGLAHHKGSTFGGLGQKDQPVTQQFQNEIYSLLDGFDINRPVWIESESSTIGRVYLPEELWTRMNNAMIMSISVPRELRIENIINQYGKFSAEQLIDKVNHLAQKLGGVAVKEISENINDGDLPSAVDKLLFYYDKSYSFSAKTHKLKNPHVVESTTLNALENAKSLLEKSKTVRV